MARPRIIKISKDRLRYLYLVEKLSPIQIANKFNCGERIVYTRLYEYGIPLRYENKRMDITKDRLEELYITQKLSIHEITRIFNCSSNTIWTKLCQFGIEVRTKSEANKEKYRIKISKVLLKYLYVDKKLDTSELAKKFNCSSTTIVKRLHRYDIPARRMRINIPRDKLEHLYVNNKKTIYQIGEKFKCGGVTILNRLKHYNISTRGKGELNKGRYRIKIPLEETRSLYLEKKLPISKIKKIFNCHHETLRKRLLRHGIPIRNISEALKGKPSQMKGKHHTLETRKKLSMLTVKQLASGKMKRQDTTIEQKIEGGLKKDNIYYKKHIPLCNVTVADFYLPEFNLVIYTDGDYWHNLPLVKNRDEKQDIILKQSGYQVLRFWEHEINKSIDDCIRRIKDQISSQI